MLYDNTSLRPGTPIQNSGWLVSDKGQMIGILLLLVILCVATGLIVSLLVPDFLFAFEQKDKQIAFLVGSLAVVATFALLLINIRWALYLFIAEMPVLTLLRIILFWLPSGIVLISPMTILLALIFCAAFLSTLRRRIWVPTRQDGLVILLAFLALIPTLQARILDLSVMNYFMAILEPTLLYLSIRMLTHSRQNQLLLLRTVIYAFGVGILVGTAEIVFRAGGNFAGFFLSGARNIAIESKHISFGFVEPLTFASIAVIFFPIGILTSLRDQHNRLLGVITLAMPVFIVLSLSRGPFVVLVLELIMAGVWLSRRKLRDWLKAIFILIVAVVILWPPLMGLIGRFNLALGLDPNTASRLFWIRTGIDLFRQHPFGIGGFNYIAYGVPDWAMPAQEFGLYQAVYYGWPYLVAFIYLMVDLWRSSKALEGTERLLVQLSLVAFVLSQVSVGAYATYADLSAPGKVPANVLGLWYFVFFAVVVSLTQTVGKPKALSRRN